jgi:hypothetical protein
VTRDWRALLVDCARKTHLLQANWARFKEAVRKSSKVAWKDFETKYRPPATEEQIAEGEGRLFKERGLLVPWQVKEFYRVRCVRAEYSIVPPILKSQVTFLVNE